MNQNPTMTFSELCSELELMHKEVGTLIEYHGGDTPSDSIDRYAVDSKLLQNELSEVGDSAIGDVPANIEEAFQDVEELIEEHGLKVR